MAIFPFMNKRGYYNKRTGLYHTKIAYDSSHNVTVFINMECRMCDIDIVIDAIERDIQGFKDFYTPTTEKDIFERIYKDGAYIDNWDYDPQTRKMVSKHIPCAQQSVSELIDAAKQIWYIRYDTKVSNGKCTKRGFDLLYNSDPNVVKSGALVGPNREFFEGATFIVSSKIVNNAWKISQQMFL